MKDRKKKPRKGTSGTGPSGPCCPCCFLGLCSCEHEEKIEKAAGWLLGPP